MRNLTIWQALAIASQMGFVLASTVAVGLIAGMFLDSRLGTGQLLTILGCFVGLLAGVVSIIQMAQALVGKRSKNGDRAP